VEFSRKLRFISELLSATIDMETRLIWYVSLAESFKMVKLQKLQAKYISKVDLEEQMLPGDEAFHLHFRTGGKGPKGVSAGERESSLRWAGTLKFN
jgi:hypothetical protein